MIGSHPLSLVGIAVGVVHEDRSGNIWISAHGRAVYRYDGSSFANFSEGEGVNTGVAMCIAEDDRGRIWCGGFGGTFRLDGDSFVNVTRDGPW